MKRYDIERLRSLPIADVAQRLGMRVSRGKAVCCFHNDHRPSLSFDLKRNTFRCYSCGAHGDAIDLAMQLLKLPFGDACHWLSNGQNALPERPTPAPKQPAAPRVDLPYLERLVARPYLCPEALRWLYDERRLSAQVVSRLGLSSISTMMPMQGDGRGGHWFNAPSLLIPYRDVNGRLLTVQARRLDGAQPRFQFPAGSGCHLYNLPVLKGLQPGEALYVAEGPSDVMALLSRGFKALGVPSATLLTTHNLATLATAIGPLTPKPVWHCYPDRDEAGTKLYEQLLNAANQLNCCLVKHTLPEGCKDFSDYWVKHLSVNA